MRAGEYSDCISEEEQEPANDCPEFDSDGALGNMEYSSIVITPWCTLTGSGSSW